MLTVPPRERLAAVQVLRGIAALLVVMVHAVASAMRPDTGFPQAWNWLASRVVDLGASGVDVFFVISGFVMAHVVGTNEHLGAGRFLRDRLIRVVPYYWLATLLFFGVAVVGDRDYLGIQLLTSLTVLPPPGAGRYEAPLLLVGWSLAFELAFYLVVATAMRLGTSLSRRLGLAATAAAALGVSGLVAVPDDNFLAVWRNPLWLEFLLGIGVWACWRKRPQAAHRFWPALLLAAGSACLLGTLPGWNAIDETTQGVFDKGQGSLRLLFWGIPGAMLLLGALWSPAESWARIPEAARKLAVATGDASYSLYLTHLSLICLYEDMLPTGFLPWFVSIPLAMAGSMAFSLLAYRFVEAPMLRLLKRWLRWPGRKPTPAFA